MKSIISLSFLLIITVCFAAQPWEPQAKTGAWLTQHQQLLETSKTHKSQIKAIFLGDSITEGWKYNGQELWAKHYAPRGAYNYGISGDTTQNVLWRIENHEFDGLTPKVVVLKIGTNDIYDGPGYSEADVAHGIKEIVNQLVMKLPETKILLLGVLPRLQPAVEAKVIKVNSIIKTLADDKRVHFLDMDAHFVDAAGHEKAGVFVDGVHLTKAGYEIWYETMEPLFAKLLL